MIPNLFHAERIYMAARRPDDYEALARWSNDPAYIQKIRLPAFPLNIEQIRKQEEDAITARGALIFRMRTLEDDHLIGTIGMYQVDAVLQSAEFGIAIGEPDYRGKGYGTEGTKLMVRYGFQEMNLHRVWLRVLETNPRAISVYEKCGFIYEGRKRQAYRRNGKWLDTLLYSILRPEWEALQQADG